MLTKRFAVALGLCLALSAVVQARTSRTTRTKPSSGPRLIPGMGEAHHAVSTKNQQAQQFFDQGLALLYGFDHEAARVSFQQAAELDPKLAMAWWGVALTLGPNYNFPADPAREKAAYEALQRALALQDNASEPERAYISALAFRYANDPKADRHQLDLAYRDAMSKLLKRFPDDLDAATLYAESLMDLHPWQLWSHDGRPNEGTEEIIAVLESVLLRAPNHLGANHYYIHAVEASPHPERGLASAARLEKLAPAAAHLAHMPSHIYARVGDYAAAARVNVNAVAAGEKFVRATGPPGMEAAMLQLHNLRFLAYANCMSGNFAEAKNAADKLVAQAEPHLTEMPMLEGFLPTPFFVLVAFERWNDILKTPTPDRELVYTLAQWHFARAMAFAASGQGSQANNEARLFASALEKLPRDLSYNSLNSVAHVGRVQENLAAGMIARANGKRSADAEITNAFQRAISAEDALNYNEPPAWFPPARPVWGQFLLEDGQAAAAEKVFRDTLEKWPRYPRALAGLRDSLKVQKRFYEMEQLDQQLQKLSDVISGAGAPVKKR